MFEREDSTERFYVSGEPADDEVVKLGFGWLGDFARAQGQDKAALVVPGLRNVDYLGRIVGAGNAAQLKKSRRLHVSGLTLELHTETKAPGAYKGPILAIWTRDKSLEKLDVAGASGICAAPWSQDNIAEWKANWNPIDVRTGEADGAQTTVSNLVVAKALGWLTHTVNVGTGLSHPDDRASAIELFRMLQRGGEPYSPNEVRAWAVRNGWAPEDARELSEVAQKILEGRRLRPHGGRWRADALEQIRREAAADEE